MTKDYQKSVESLHLFLADTEGETREEISHELRAAGVNVDDFVRDIKSMAKEIRPAAIARPSRLARFANMTRAEILGLLEKVQAGASSTFPSSVLSHLEESNIHDLSDEQLRELLVKLDEDSDEMSEG